MYQNRQYGNLSSLFCLEEILYARRVSNQQSHKDGFSFFQRPSHSWQKGKRCCRVLFLSRSMNLTRLLATASAASPSRIAHSSCCKRYRLHARYYSSQPPGITRFVERQRLHVPPFNTLHSDPKVSRPAVNPNSIFAGDSAWDHMFSNLDDYKARSSPSRRELNPVKRAPKPPQPQRGSQSSRRQTMTAREMSAFDDVFNMIFD